MAKMGRPTKPVDWEIVGGLIEILCTHEEIAHILKITVETLHSACLRDNKITFSELYKRHSSVAKASLRRRQLEVALYSEKPNVGMLIWLGKNWLDQSDKIVHSGDDEKPPLMLAYKIDE